VQVSFVTHLCKAACRRAKSAHCTWILAGLLAIVLACKPSEGPLGTGSVAPDFHLTTLTGEQVSLSDFRGQVVLLNFWATWCGPCQDEMPSMEKLYKALEGEGFALLAVSVDEAKENVVGFRDAYQLSFPILLDSNMEVANLYQTYRYPESLLIDRSGVILARYIGPRDWFDPSTVSDIRKTLVVHTATRE